MGEGATYPGLADGEVLMAVDRHRAWFGPKRIGFGLRPQTWQGWLVTAGLAALAVAIGVLLGR